MIIVGVIIGVFITICLLLLTCTAAVVWTEAKVYREIN